MSAFKGQRVMLSRTLVPPEIYDMLHEVLKDNGADVCPCSNPDYNSSTDFHVLPSSESEKFAELRGRGCQIVGPECILRCAKLRRLLPSSPYTCCLTFDGTRILSTGFEGSEKNRINQVVTAMCGEFCTKATRDVDFVIAKDVLTPKYKWAACILRKPILSIQWLYHCFREHRRVPHEPYRLPIFTGVILCTTGISLEKRNKIADFVESNGGTLRADLTRECTHLIANSAASDKFKVAQHWKQNRCVNEDWFWNSVSEKICLQEIDYPVGSAAVAGPKAGPVTSGPPPPPPPPTSKDTPGQDAPSVVLRSFSEDAGPPAPAPVPLPVPESAPAVRPANPEPDAQWRRGEPTTSCAPTTSREGPLYLSDCQFFLTGFDVADYRRVLNMVLDGGGTRYMEYKDSVTHVVVGRPSERELKDIRQYAMSGCVHIVLPAWLEECTRQSREVPLNPQFIVPEAHLHDPSYWQPGQNKAVPANEKRFAGESSGQNKAVPANEKRFAGESSGQNKTVPANEKRFAGKDSGAGDSSGARVTQRKLWDAPGAQPDTAAAVKQQPVSTIAQNPARHPRQDHQKSHPVSSQVPQKQIPGFSDPVGVAEEPVKHTATSSARGEDARCEATTSNGGPHLNSEANKRVLEGLVFGFAPSFEACLRAEVVQWVLQGGGVILGELGSCELLKAAEFMISPHGSKIDLRLKSSIKNVSAQWIKYCLQEGTLLDIDSHILFRPLCCEVPLPGFQALRFAVTQYADRERVLLYNLSHILGAKYQEKKMTKKSTHLLCKVGDGDKYEAALKWGVEIVTAEWLFACVAQNTVVCPGPHRPKKLTAAEKEAGLGIATQNPIQLTAQDSGVPFMERGTAENNAEIRLSAKENEIGKVLTKGKTPNTKRKSSLRGKLQALQGNRPLTECSLTSQNGGDLDPWDELTASWANDDAVKRPKPRSARSQHKKVTPVRESSLSLDVPVDLGLGETHRQLPTKQDDEPAKGSEGVENHGRAQISVEPSTSADPLGNEKEEDDCGRDVAAAIEGLLAQTSKVQSEDASRSPDRDRDLLSHDIIKLGRRNAADMRDRGNFKRPKRAPNRPIDGSGEEPVQSAPPAEDSYEKFEESEMDSQVVAYDEDHSEKQRIMERVRTRSMSTSSSSGSGVSAQRTETSWKATELKRLLKAADANK